MEQRILSIDVSKRCTGYYIPHSSEYGTIKTTQEEHGDNFELFQYIVNKIFELYKQHKCELILMEDGFSFGKNKQETQKLVELRACIKYECLKQNIKIITYPPTVIKKVVAGKGNGKKQDIMESIKNNKKYFDIVQSMGGLHTSGKNKNDDIFDAIAIYETYMILEIATEED